MVCRTGCLMSDPAYETRRVPVVGGVELAVDIWRLTDETAPLRPAFVLIHGLASNARMYDGVATWLGRGGRTSATLDLRGHGRSDKPDSGYDYDTMCADLAAVLASLADDPGVGVFGRPVIVGQSFGGNLVLEFAARYPEMLAGVACIDGGTIDLQARFGSWEEAEAALRPPAIAGTGLAELEQRFAEMHPDWHERGIRGALANFEVRADGTVAPWLTLERHMKIVRTMWESRPPYAEVKVPVLLLPVDSPQLPPEWSRAKHEGVDEALSTLERAQVYWFSPADHDVHAQYPKAVAAILVAAATGLFA